MFKAVFIDLDGTLLRSDHSVGDLTKSSIKKIMAKGISVVLVSARPLDAILPVSQLIGATDYPIASLNGGYIVSGKEVIFKSSINLDTTQGITTEIKPLNPAIIYYVEREWFSENYNPWVEHEQKILDVRVKIWPLEEILHYLEDRKTGPNKLLVMKNPAEINQIEIQTKTLFPDLNIYTSNPTNLEIMSEDASKSNAIKILIKTMGIDQSEVIAIGDNFNDEGMIQFAGMGIAMGNAPEEVKALADYVTDTNNNDGVGKALDRFIP